ncbi:MAG: hypothetical protein JWM53_4804 [bacterium]|nr:hypothetical protein [bacterium]
MHSEVGPTETSATNDALPMAPGLNGATTPSVAPATEDTFVCLSGPCWSYWERYTSFGDGLHRQRLRHCTYGSGTVDLTDDNVFSCNRHDPPRLLRRLIRILGL